MSQRIALRAGALVVLSAFALTACAATGTDGAAAGGDCAPSEGPVELTFTSWLPGIDEAVAIWNEENPDIQVTVQTGPNGNGGTYQNFFNQIEAGNAPDLGQIEYDALPNFRVQDGLENIAACAGVADASSTFIDWTWSQVTFGEENSVYAVPQDIGPEALYYRADLFEAAGIPVPTTWEEYATAAEAIRAEGGYITNFSQSDINAFAGLVWQNGGQWFENDGTEWSVTMDSAESTEVAEYWQSLIEAAQFALWLNSDADSLTAMNRTANIYPATVDGGDLPIFAEGLEFYGGQKIYEVFAEAAANVNPNFTWGPTMTQTYTDVADGFSAALAGNQTILDALVDGQSKTIAALKAQAIPVKE